MLKKKARLPRKEFVFRGREAARTDCFSLKTRKSIAGSSRIGIVVGKSVAKSAARRNFLKRQLRALIAKGARPGVDYMIVALPGIARETKREIREQVASALRAISSE